MVGIHLFFVFASIVNIFSHYIGTSIGLTDIMFANKFTVAEKKNLLIECIWRFIQMNFQWGTFIFMWTKKDPLKVDGKKSSTDKKSAWITVNMILNGIISYSWLDLEFVISKKVNVFFFLDGFHSILPSRKTPMRIVHSPLSRWPFSYAPINRASLMLNRWYCLRTRGQ